MLCAQLLFSWCSTLRQGAAAAAAAAEPLPLLPDAFRRCCYCCCSLQTEAEAEAKAAETRSKHTQKQLAEQRKALASKEKEGSKLVKELARERSAVEQCRQAAAALGHDPAAAAALEADVEAQGGEVRRLRDRVDELASHLAGGTSRIQPRLLACWLPRPCGLLALTHADACVFAISHSALLLKLVGRRRQQGRMSTYTPPPAFASSYSCTASLPLVPALVQPSTSATATPSATLIALESRVWWPS
jgi:hypothetical protein